MALNFKSSVAEKVFLFLILCAFLFFLFPFLTIDLWNDEIYTLKYFTFVSPLTTITDYRVPNNHVLFNLVNNLYLRLIGEKSLYSLMEHTWVLRIIPLLYTAGTIFFTYKCAEKLSGRTTALLSIILLCTTVPFYNFALQVRGYGMSMFLLTAASYYLFCYLDTPKKLFLFLIALFVGASAYAIPLNLYAVAGIMFFVVVMIVISFYEKEKTGNKLPLLISLIAGVCLAILLYVPVFRQVFFNEYVAPDVVFTFKKWSVLVRSVFVYFFSHRYWLMPFLAVGGVLSVYEFVKEKNIKGLAAFLFLLCILVIPFLISLIRKDESPERVFVNLVPFFALLMSWALDGLFKFIQNLKTIFLLEAVIALYCFAILSQQMKHVSDQLEKDILTSGRSYNLYYSYYMHHYRPLTVVKTFKETLYHDSDWVFIRDAEPWDLPVYLDKYSIPVQDFSRIDSGLTTGKKVFVFSRYPNEIGKDSFSNEHHCNVKLVSEGLSYHNLFELSLKDKEKE